MAEYIDREAAFGVIRAENLAGCWDSVKDGLYKRLKRAQERYIASIPAADVAKVRHGFWIEWNDGEGDTFNCSVCGEVWILNAGTPKENNMHYCPNCGAKMEEAVE